MKNRVTIENLLKRKKSFFASYEVNVDLWDAENFDPEVDFFDLEDMLASRYWLHYLQREGRLTKEENQKLEELDEKFLQKKIPEFVKERYPAIYDKWIGKINKETEIIVDISSIERELEEFVRTALSKETGWTEVVIPSGVKNEDNTLQPAAA